MIRCLPIRLFSLLLLTLPAASAKEDFYASLEGFFEAHCYECHDELSEKGGLDLYAISTDLSDPAILEKWVRIYDRVAHGEMPPKDKKAPTNGEKRLFSEFLSPSLITAHEREKGTVLRRLNRKEYQNTLNDMLGIHGNFSEDLPEDGRSQEFDNVGSALGISMIQMQQYLKSADAALEMAIASTLAPPEVHSIKATYSELEGNEKFYGKQWLLAPDGATIFYKAHSYPSGLVKSSGVKESGWYRIKITGYAHQSDKPITFSVGGYSYARGSKRPTYGYHSLPPGKPTTIEFTAWMDSRFMVEITPQGLYDPDRLITNEGIENYKGPGLAINHVEVEGPLTPEFPTRGHQLIFENLSRTEIEPKNPKDKTKSWYQPKFTVETDNTTADASNTLKRFATEAFRRPATDETIAPYLILFQSEMHQGETFETALRTALVAILCSTDFLYLKESPGLLDDYALASRLSYFLTRTAPDAELISAANENRLTGSPDSLQLEAERLMSSPGFDRFITDFTDAWLDLREIEFTNPDEKLFPEFDRYLQHSMVDETRAFMRHLIDQNLGIENVVKSDFAMLNWRLADHYGIDGVTSTEVQPVSLPADSARGGLLSQGSILKVSANGTNTSPVLRGVWVNERILGKHPAPPPPGIPGVEPDIRGAETLRELLDKHRDSENCQSCHTMIDPPGFALESFNPIGGWRDHFRNIGGEGEKPEQRFAGEKQIRYKIGLAVDPSGQLEDGRTFSSFNEFRDIISEDRDQLAKALVTKLLIFGTGREMGFSDRKEISQIVKASAAKGHGVRDLVLLTVNSDIFKNK